MRKSFTIILTLALLGLLSSCGGSRSRSWQRNPVDDMVRDLSAEPIFSIILHDMDVQGNFVKTYLHKYKVVTLDNDSIPQVETTGWEEVSEKFFFAHENDMGMEVASKAEDGTVSKISGPAGHANYVGNPRYGEWRTDNSGNSFWSFYGKYRLMTDIFGWGSRPIYRNDYYDYRNNYYGRRPYYGNVSSSGNPRYGTNSDYNRRSRPNFFDRRAQKNGFQRSSSRNRTSSTSSNRTSRSRTSRSSSRYSGSSSRSRGGGFGK